LFAVLRRSSWTEATVCCSTWLTAISSRPRSDAERQQTSDDERSFTQRHSKYTHITLPYRRVATVPASHPQHRAVITTYANHAVKL